MLFGRLRFPIARDMFPIARDMGLHEVHHPMVATPAMGTGLLTADHIVTLDARVAPG